MTEVSDENLIRVLAGNKMIQNWRCRIGWHRWSVWEYDPRHMDQNFNFTGTGLMSCECADCNLRRHEYPRSRTVKQSK